MSGKTILYVFLITLALLLLLISFGVLNTNFNKSIGNATNGEYINISEKCRLPSGESIDSWKEHLGHHSDLQECLKYFD